MGDMRESHAASHRGIVFSISYALGSRLLISGSPVDHFSKGVDQSSCRFIVIRASSIVRIAITSWCVFSFSSQCTFSKWFSGWSSKCSSKCVSECSSKCSSECSYKSSSEYFSECNSQMHTPVLHAVKVRKHTLESYHGLVAPVLFVPAQYSDNICDIRPTGDLRVHEASDHQLVYGQIAGSFRVIALLKLLHHKRGKWSGIVHCELH